ncbi:GNAT family N-acetyltransferase [Marinigracilibium pacificum]|uniref:GNAT family N-acetyltransferase n=1 Tax=Marinigracilibium pacificum TaxID=2729599 RepID=A0A848IVP1_9BACT|nr:GNAT family N-acetyltransferase [Marinigracilibium pacificum]NMM47756.1 GNAT family N-acetyltransferase [Marinigracilibium pacificum]
MKYIIEPIEKSDYKNVVDVWEASVRATHDFLLEEDILYFKPLILSTYLDAVILKCLRNEKRDIIGFSGVADSKLEMLFIDPYFRGKGIGKALLQYGVNHQKVNSVDVNEQNVEAVDFYKHFGFEVISRSETDPSGKPYPILHMALL